MVQNEYIAAALLSLEKLTQIPPKDAETIRNGLLEIVPLRDRDTVLEEMWDQFSNISMNPETECIAEQFMGWGPGIHREEIWKWFDCRHSKGVAYLLYGETENYVVETKRLYELKTQCEECMSHYCAYANNGECRYPLVHGKKPTITEYDGCIDFVYDEREHK